jgi:hypothetical protein
MECLYDHSGCGRGMHSAGGISLFDGLDFSSCDRLLSGILDLFLCGPV